MKRLTSSGYYLIIAAALGFSIKSIMAKLAFSYGVDAMTLLVMRVFIALPFFILTLFILEGKNAFKITRAEAGLYALMGIVGLGGAMLMSFYSLERIEASIATILIFTYPTMTVVMLAIFFKERFGATKLLSLVLTLVGLAMVVRADSVALLNLKGTGILLALGAAFFAASHSVLTQKAISNISPIRVITFSIFFLALFLGIFFGNRTYPTEPEVWAIASVLGIVTGFFGFIAMTYGMKKLGAYRAVVISSISPVLTVIWASLFLAEGLDYIQISGMALVLLGVAAVKLRSPVRVISGRGDDFTRQLEEATSRTGKRQVAFILKPIFGNTEEEGT